jgi:hypothetical protein
MIKLKKSWYSKGGGTPSRKFAITCGDKIKHDTPTTTGWLSADEQIVHDSNFRLYMGLLENRKHIVVKVGDPTTLKKEYDFGEKLYAAHVSNFIKYYCQFQCAGNVNTDHSLCQGPGNMTGILVMSNYQYGRIDKHRWSSKEEINAVLKQICIACITAFWRCNFVHKDLHLGNVLVKKTRKESVEYGIITHGWTPVIMDFDRSIYTTEPEALYRDLNRVISLCNTELNLKMDFRVALDLLKDQDRTCVSDTLEIDLCRAIDMGECRGVDRFWYT